MDLEWRIPTIHLANRILNFGKLATEYYDYSLYSYINMSPSNRQTFAIRRFIREVLLCEDDAMPPKSPKSYFNLGVRWYWVKRGNSLPRLLESKTSNIGDGDEESMLTFLDLACSYDDIHRKGKWKKLKRLKQLNHVNHKYLHV